MPLIRVTQTEDVTQGMVVSAIPNPPNDRGEGRGRPTGPFVELAAPELDLGFTSEELLLLEAPTPHLASWERGGDRLCFLQQWWGAWPRAAVGTLRRGRGHPEAN